MELLRIGLGVEFAGAFGFCDLEAGDDAGDGDFVLWFSAAAAKNTWGSGFISQAVTVKGLKVSAGAREKIVAAGGRVEE